MAIVHESFATSTTPTCAKPAGTAVGDVLVAFFYASSTPSIPGFTLQIYEDSDGAGLGAAILTRVVDGSEGSTFTEESVAYALQLSRFSGVDTSSVIDGTPTSAFAFANTATPASIATANDDSMLILFGIGYDDAVTALATGAGMTEQYEVPISGLGRVSIGTEARPTAGATGGRTVTATGSATITAAAMLALKAIPSEIPVTIVAPRATGSGLGRAPVVVAGQTRTIVAPRATGVGVANAPTIVAAQARTIVAPHATGVGQAWVPAVLVSAPILIEAPFASGSGDAYEPTVLAERAIVLIAPLASGTGFAYAALIGDYTILIRAPLPLILQPDTPAGLLTFQDDAPAAAISAIIGIHGADPVSS